MFSAFNNLLFSALERFAKALDYLGKAAEMTAKGFADEVELENAAKVKQLKSELDKA